MDIAAASICLSQYKAAQQVSISVMKIAMEAMKGQATDLTSMLADSVKNMALSVHPEMGANLDIYA